MGFSVIFHSMPSTHFAREPFQIFALLVGLWWLVLFLAGLELHFTCRILMDRAHLRCDQSPCQGNKTWMAILFDIVWNAGGTVNFRFQDDPGDVAMFEIARCVSIPSQVLRPWVPVFSISVCHKPCWRSKSCRRSCFVIAWNSILCGWKADLCWFASEKRKWCWTASLATFLRLVTCVSDCAQCVGHLVELRSSTFSRRIWAETQSWRHPVDISRLWHCALPCHMPQIATGCLDASLCWTLWRDLDGLDHWLTLGLAAGSPEIWAWTAWAF